MGNKEAAKRRRSSGQSRFKMKKFTSNRFTNEGKREAEVEQLVDNVLQQEQPSCSTANRSSARYRKLNSRCSVNNKDEISPNTTATPDMSHHYILLDSRILQNILSVIGSCPLCKCNNITFSNNVSKKKGLADCIEIACGSTNCDYTFNTYSSNRVSKPNQPGPDPFDVNVRSLIAFREIGRGYTAMETFFGYMNCVPPMSYPAFREMNMVVGNVYSDVASESMLRGVCELRGDKDDEETCDITVSCDGTWQRRGYSSLNGVLSIISDDTGKVIDYEVMSKKCAQCTSWVSRKGTEEYNEFMATHESQCLINHQGSAGTMESKGVVVCFKRSVDKYNVRYTQYLGDGDTKSYHEVDKEDPYNGTPIVKLECIGHIQKRVGARILKEGRCVQGLGYGRC